jgi:hypothetical protein
MPSSPGLFPEVPPPNNSGDDSELESLLYLASTFQAYQRTARRDSREGTESGFNGDSV